MTWIPNPTGSYKIFLHLAQFALENVIGIFWNTNKNNWHLMEHK